METPTAAGGSGRPQASDDQRLALGGSADASNRSTLNATELTVSELLAEGHSVSAVARQLELPRSTVVSHLRRIFDKVGAQSRTERARAAEAIAQSARTMQLVDATKRQIERDLHDGLQQHLIGLGVRLSAAELAVAAQNQDLRKELHEIGADLRDVLADVREISHGAEPAILREQGLEPALQALAKRSPVPVNVIMKLPGKLPRACESAAYFTTAEALANVAKHARASSAEVVLEHADGFIIHSIRDDGAGGADQDGAGISGLRRRARARGGSLEVTSPPGGGTLLVMKIPFDFDTPDGGHHG